MASLTGQNIKDTYQSLLKTEDNGLVTTAFKNITDGSGSASGLYLKNDGVYISGSLVLSGSLLYSGSTIDATVTSASYALTASYALNGESTDTGSFATTGSNTFIGTQTIDGNLFMSGAFRLVYNNDPTNNMLFGQFDGANIHGPYYQLFGNQYPNVAQRGGAEFVYDTRNGGDANFHISSFNGSNWTQKFRVDDNGAQITGSLGFGDGSLIQAIPNSSGDGLGAATLELKPDTSLGTDQYIVLDPTSPGHIHVRAGGAIDASSAYLYLGGENNNVRVSDYGSVEISATNTITTKTGSNEIGLKLDFANAQYSLGDFNNTTGSTKLVIDDNARTVSISGSTTVTGSLTVVAGGNVEFQATSTGIKAGNSTTDRHTITGSLDVSGSGRFTNGLQVTSSLYVTGSDPIVFSATGDVFEVSGSFVTYGDATITNVLTLPYQNPLPASPATGSIALSGSGATFVGMFVWTGTWTQI